MPNGFFGTVTREKLGMFFMLSSPPHQFTVISTTPLQTSTAESLVVDRPLDGREEVPDEVDLFPVSGEPARLPFCVPTTIPAVSTNTGN